MAVVSVFINIKTKAKTEVVDITERVREALSKSGLKNGIVNISVNGSTAGLTTIEYEPALVSDIKKLFDKLIPSNVQYAHDATWGDANGYSHLRASLLKPSLTIAFVEGQLYLGTWQQIVLLDFDNRSRERKILMQFIGE